MKPDLIKTLEEVQENVPVSMSSDFDMVAPFLRSAESLYLVKIIGKAQFLELIAAYNYDADAEGAGPVPAEELVQAILFAQKVIANLGYYQAVPILSVSIGAGGIQINSSENTKNAFQWQTEDVLDSLQELGFAGIEELLEYLQDHLDIFSAYAESDEYKEQQTFLIRSAAVFSKHYDIDGSRFVYQKLLPLMRRVEVQTMNRIFGEAFYESLKAADLSPAKKKLVENYLQPGVALLTAAKAMVERVITLKDGKVAFNFRGNYNNMKESMAATREQVKATTDQLETDGSDFIASALQIVLNNPADFEEYVAPETKRRFKFNNDPAKGVVGF
jgi:hypothetical protein